MEKLKDEQMEHHQSFEAKDPLTESIYSLQIAKEALEQEVKKFGDICNQPLLSASTSLELKALSKSEDSKDEYLADANSVSVKTLEKQGSLSRIQVQVPNRIEDFGDIIAVVETCMIERSVYKLTFLFSLQFILLILVFLLFDSRLSIDSAVVAPT
ncbi:hypothetical protein HN51_000777 [Arachis hypogaea]|uniref:Uncharacterized protein LOC107478894 n=2 Tax=Arachis TaxID=3817 RepID=A0A6P4CNM8_ARADU|nr:uncharacterized protein LOC107478894 [Arachis duranensis]XP_025694641.1 uncharacterized protein LOC112796423 [Arachis hypogaea]XP_052114321.1 uncharacterized protein LOC127745556 [Arachis duranensis]QHO48765.1 uncharacterized protein DS421_1g08190 [Arachis hypogaea]RYR79132.1 hypothetical protein Ahy_A01g003988 [Arachis hypogaea]